MLPIQPLYHCIISVSSSALCGTGYGSKAETVLTESSEKAVTCQLSSAIGGAVQNTGLLLVDGVAVSSHYARVNGMGVV